MKFFLALLVALFFSAVMAEVDETAVVELSTDNFDEIIGGELPVMVKFFAPWCGHCKRAAAPYAEAAAKVESQAILANVDCTGDARPLCTRMGIRGYPTIKVFHNNMAYDFRGKRTAEDFEAFVTEGYKTAEGKDFE
eukprot:TRINITY_DN12_c0_g1_i2.p3 TRINITY_DN12_c0_g1~~TRINITY_DN12_c0_g1_i2.p3  ORF type:complete len:137 (-),score=58.29 TRINITY_DN12_c0_g1_i2:141-551(-)